MNTEIRLEELFPGSTIRSGPGLSVHFDAMQPEAAARIAAHLGLVYIDHTAEDVANVCQANAMDVRPEYRTAANAHDVFYYLLAALQDQPEEVVSLPYPTDVIHFWTLVERGRKLDFERSSDKNK